jgi:hypothetical protein
VGDGTRASWTRSNSLIVIAKGGPRGACVTHVCRVVRLLPCKIILIQISVTPSDIDGTCSLLSFRRSAISLCSYEIFGYV